MFASAVTQNNSVWTNAPNIKPTRAQRNVPCPIEFPALGMGNASPECDMLHSHGIPSNLDQSQSPSPIRVFTTWHPTSDEISVVTPNEEMDMAFEDWDYRDEIELAMIHRELKREYAKLKDYLLFMDPEEEYDIEFEHDDWYTPLNFGLKRDFHWTIRGLWGGRDWEVQREGGPIGSMFPVMSGYGTAWC